MSNNTISRIKVWWYNARFNFAYWLLGAKSMKVTKKEMTNNLYHYHEEAIRDMREGRTPLGSIVTVLYRSGNGSNIRFHGWNYDEDVMVGCSMGWDNGATTWYDLRNTVIQDVEIPKEELCDQCKKRVHMWHKHSIWCTPQKPFPLVARRKVIA